MTYPDYLMLYFLVGAMTSLWVHLLEQKVEQEVQMGAYSLRDVLFWGLAWPLFWFLLAWGAVQEWRNR